MKKGFEKCFYKDVCVNGYNHPKECKSCFSFVKMTNFEVKKKIDKIKKNQDL